MLYLDNTGGFFILLFLIVVWSVIVKGVALWTAARHKQKGWFILLLVVNTLGILEIIYLVITKQKQTSPRKRTKTAFETLVEKEEKLSSRQQAILRILTGILDDKQQATVSDAALKRAVVSIEDRIGGTLTQTQLQNMLDKTQADGGVGLYKQTAKHIAEHVEAIVVAMKQRRS